MQARTRRNRVAILVAMTLCFTSTGSMQSDRNTTQRSGAANTVFAATTGDFAIDTDVQAVSGADIGGSSLEAGAEQYEEAELRKADLYEYDDSLTIVSYEAAAPEPDDPLTMNTAVITETTKYSDKSEVNYTTTLTTIEEPAATAPQTVIAEPDSVVFYSSGYGHGVGMSQNGANFYAMYDGWTYDQILMKYYPGTQLVQTGTLESEKMTVGGKTDTVVSILSQICYNEMGSTFSVEAIKAQAIAAYTFYLYHGYGNGMICKSNPPQKVVDAVKSVLGIVVYYNGAPALTSFYASSGGCTASCKDIFFEDIPYLTSVPVQHDDTADPHYSEATVFSTATLKAKLQNKYHVQLTGNPSEWLHLEYGDGGYVAYAVIGGKVRVKGNDLRAVLGLKSPKFEFVYQGGSEPTAPVSTDVVAADAENGATHASVSDHYTGSTTIATTTIDTTTMSPETTDETMGAQEN